MNVKPIIRLEEVEEHIVLPNPGGRRITIRPAGSGLEEEQVFTSKDLPDEIPYELLGFVEFPSGSVYPKYMANVITTKELGLGKKDGAVCGVEIVDKVVWSLTYQEDIMISAQSINVVDLKSFKYRSENLRYWLASPATGASLNKYYFGLGAVDSGRVNVNCLFVSDGSSFEYWLGVRPTMVLKSKVQLDPSKIRCVEL